MANRVIPPHRRDPDDSHDSQYYRRGVDDIRNVITSTTEPLGAEPGTLWYNPEGVPDYGVDIGISKDDADELYTSKDEFEAVETALAGKADADHRHDSVYLYATSRSNPTNVPLMISPVTVSGRTQLVASIPAAGRQGQYGESNAVARADHLHTEDDITGLSTRLSAIEARLDALEGDTE